MNLPFTQPFLCSFVLALLGPGAIGASLTPEKPVELAGTHGKFDFIKVDPARHLLLACHTQNGTLDVVDEKTSTLRASVPTGAAQGVVSDDQDGLYFVSVSKPPRMTVIDALKLTVVGSVPLPGPADILAYDPDLHRVFVCDDSKPEQWVIDPVARRIVATLPMPGAGMEDLGFDPQYTFLFQNLKEVSVLAKIDPVARRVVATWPTAPAEKPHGLAIVPGSNSVLVVGGNGKLVLMSLTTGRVLSSTNVSPKVDEIAYDPGLRRVYCASGLGTISVVALSQGRLTTMAAVPSSPGAHSIAIDPTTHTVWIAFAKDGKAFVQAFRP